MTYQVKVSKETERDLVLAKCHYRISGLEQDFDADFVYQIQYLKSNPFLFQIYYRSIRRIHLKRFRYSIHYLVKDDIVYILRVLAHQRDYK